MGAKTETWFLSVLAACGKTVAKHYQSKLFVVHVISPLVYRSVPPELLAEAPKPTRLEAAAQLARLQRRQGGTTGFESEAVLREGDVADSLLRLVSEYNIDLLVVATRGYRHLKRLLLGSVAEKLFRHARCMGAVASRSCFSAVVEKGRKRFREFLSRLG